MPRLAAAPVLWRALLTALLLLGMLPSAVGGERHRRERRPVDLPESIVVLDPGVDPEQAARDLGVRPTFVFRHVITGFAGKLPAAAISAASRSKRVRTVVPDQPIGIAAKNKKKRKRQKRNRNRTQVVPTGISRIAATESVLASIDGAAEPALDVDVAVLDTGIAAHPDLNVAGGTSCQGSSYADDNGHGTHVAGTIGARDNRMGVVGVAPGARLWAVKVLGADGLGAWSSIICGLDWVYANRGTIDVVNMSIGGTGQDGPCDNSAPLHLAICNVVKNADIPVVVAAGNTSQDAANFIPAAYDEVITVSALADSNGRPGGGGPRPCGLRQERDDVLASFSNYGADVDVAAPGVCILSTVPGSYGNYNGTSMAAPHVTGALALFLSKEPGATEATARSWLLGEAVAAQDSTAGFVGRAGSPEPVLFLGP